MGIYGECNLYLTQKSRVDVISSAVMLPMADFLANLDSFALLHSALHSLLVTYMRPLGLSAPSLGTIDGELLLHSLLDGAIFVDSDAFLF